MNPDLGEESEKRFTKSQGSLILNGMEENYGVRAPGAEVDCDFKKMKKVWNNLVFFWGKTRNLPKW